MNHYWFEYRPYDRPFKQPLHTHHGWWSNRQGIILRLTSANGQVGWGEIAPIAWFGTETLAQALAFCRSLPSKLAAAAIEHIPASLPACRFGFESALEMMQISTTPITFASPSPNQSGAVHNSYLLPTGEAALHAWQPLVTAGVNTFKWKIGVANLEDELQIFNHLMQNLPADVRLRLDANGGLDYYQAYQWLQTCDWLSGHTATVEFLEQPLSKHQLKEMLQLAERVQTPIALDESVATFEQLEACYTQGWRGMFVIKPALIGSPQQLRNFCQQYCLDLVWSSALETPIAQYFIQHVLIPSIPVVQHRAIGFGVDQWFNDAWTTEGNFEQLWQSLSLTGTIE